MTNLTCPSWRVCVTVNHVSKISEEIPLLSFPGYAGGTQGTSKGRVFFFQVVSTHKHLLLLHGPTQGTDLNKPCTQRYRLCCVLLGSVGFVAQFSRAMSRVYTVRCSCCDTRRMHFRRARPASLEKPNPARSFYLSKKSNCFKETPALSPCLDDRVLCQTQILPCKSS